MACLLRAKSRGAQWFDGRPSNPSSLDSARADPEPAERVTTPSESRGVEGFPADDLQEVREATVVLKDGRGSTPLTTGSSRITLHLLEGDLDDIRRQLDRSLAAFFDFYPEICSLPSRSQARTAPVLGGSPFSWRPGNLLSCKAIPAGGKW